MAKKVLAYDNKILIMPSGEAVEAPAGGTGGGGDMYKEDYDADEVVLNAGGIESYIEGELVNKADLINGKVPTNELQLYPILTVTPQMVISQDPLTFQLTTEQGAILESQDNTFICLDASSLGVGASVFTKSQSNISNHLVLVNNICNYINSTLIPTNATSYVVIYDKSNRHAVYSELRLANSFDDVTNLDIDELFAEVHPLGGKIFYDNGENGAVYKFYSASGEEITYDGTLASLDTATQYKILGEPAFDRFYAYDNTTHTTGGKTATDGLVVSTPWGYYNITTGVTTNTIGSGKTNTTAILQITDTSEYSASIFKYVKDCNDALLNGCNDWYIASKAEQDKLIESNLVDWYTSNSIWASIESTATVASRYVNDSGNWGTSTKSGLRCCFVTRSF